MDKQKSNPQLLTSEVQVDRLCSREKWVNPYEVLLIGYDAKEQEIRSKFRKLSVLVHPDKCHDERAVQAFHILESAYKTLLDPEKRSTYQRIMREARERVEFDRRKEDQRRQMLGLGKLPLDTFESEVTEMCNRIFREIEERKFHFDKYEFMARKRQREEEEHKREEERAKQAQEKEWERSRDKRVAQWRKFTVKKDKKSHKKRMKGFEIRPPGVRMEARNPSNV